MPRLEFLANCMPRNCEQYYGTECFVKWIRVSVIVFFLMTRISVKLMNQMARNVTINQYPQIKVENKMILVLGMTRRF